MKASALARAALPAVTAPTQRVVGKATPGRVPHAEAYANGPSGTVAITTCCIGVASAVSAVLGPGPCGTAAAGAVGPRSQTVGPTIADTAAQAVGDAVPGPVLEDAPGLKVGRESLGRVEPISRVRVGQRTAVTPCCVAAAATEVARAVMGRSRPGLQRTPTTPAPRARVEKRRPRHRHEDAVTEAMSASRVAGPRTAAPVDG